MSVEWQDKECRRCKRLCSFAQTICMDGNGPLDTDIVFVGEAPGREEDEAETVFVGRCGRYTNKHIFRAVGLERINIRMTNAVRCRPPQNKTPNIGEIRNCRNYIMEELLHIKPKVVVLLGNVPLHSILPIHRKKSDAKEKPKPTAGVSGITKWRGKVIWHEKLNCWVIPTWHPSGVMRLTNRGIIYRKEQLIDDVETAIRLAGKARPKYKYPNYYGITTGDKALKVIEGIMKSKVYAVDLETDSLDAYSASIIGISLSDTPDRGFYIDWGVIESSSLLKQKLQYLLTRKDRLRVLHNGAYDEKVLYFNGWKLGRYYDTMLAAALLDENFSKTLKDLTWIHLKFGGYDQELDEYRRVNRIKSFKDIPFKIMFKYASLDAAATLGLYLVFKLLLQQQGIWEHFITRQMPTRRVLTMVEIGGFATNTDYSKKLMTTTDKMITRLEKVIYRGAGEEFNINSRLQLGNVLFKKLRLPVVKYTATGQPSTDKSVLEELSVRESRGGRVARALMQRTKVKKAQSTFIKAVLNNTRDDGKIHTSYNIIGTVTGRCSCSNPGIHNVPRDKAIRTQFVSEDGCSLIVTDIKSAELRALAHYSRELALIRAFNEGRDIHSETYNIMYGMPADYQPTDDERFIAKTINFGLIYGRGARSLAAQLGISVEEAYDLIDQYFEKLPRAKKFLDGTVQFAKNNGYVVSIFGRRRRLPAIQTDDDELVARAGRQAKNSLIQGTAAELTFVVMVRIYKQMKREKLKARIVHTVHDSIIINCPDSEVKRVTEIVNECFAEPIPEFSVKLAVDIDIEQRWGEHKHSDLIDLYNKLRGRAA